MVTILGPLQPSPPLSATASPPSPPTSIKKKKRSKALKKAKSPDNNGSALEAAQPDITNDPKEEQARVELIVEKARAEGMTVVEEPKGRPMFQFFMAEGRTKPVMTFVDSGCSDAIFREGIPSVQWEGTITKHGLKR